MANSAQARKRAKQAEKRRQRNASDRSAMRTSIKKVLTAIEEGNKDSASTALKDAMPIIDRSSGKGIIHKNKAARYKSRLNKKVKAM